MCELVIWIRSWTSVSAPYLVLWTSWKQKCIVPILNDNGVAAKAGSLYLTSTHLSQLRMLISKSVLDTQCIHLGFKRPTARWLHLASYTFVVKVVTFARSLTAPLSPHVTRAGGMYYMRILQSTRTRICISQSHRHGKQMILLRRHSLVPRPLPAFQCCMQKSGRAWYSNSRAPRIAYARVERR